MFEEIFYTNVIHQGGSMLSSQIKVKSLEDVQAGQGVSFSLKKVWLKKNLEMVATLNESERNPYENNA